MKKIKIIFLKELKDTLRDKRTIMAMVVVPLLIYPVMITIVTGIIKSQTKESMNKTLKVAVFDAGEAENLIDLYKDASLIEVNEFESYPQLDSIQLSGDTLAFKQTINTLIRDHKLDAAIIVKPGFDQRIDSLKAGHIALYYQSTTDQGITKQRLMMLVNMYKEKILKDRYKMAGLNPEFVEVVHIEDHDVATQKEKMGEVIGGLIPYFFIIFCLLGSMYPAIDLGAGEKERGTIETILTAPATRLQILMGKLGVILLGGIGSASISIIGILIAVQTVDVIPSNILSVIESILQIKSIAMILLLLIPLAIFFGASLFSISIYAKSYKEAQSMISPAMIIVFLPAMIGMLPGIHFTYTTALIPILNVTLATKQIIADTIDPVLFAETMLSLLVLAGLALWLAINWYGKESNVLRA